MSETKTAGCSCRKDIEARLLEAFIKSAPDAKRHALCLRGYSYLIGEKVTEVGCMTIEMAAEYPLKKGGFKEKTRRSNMIFNYCPFCGEKYQKEVA